MAHHNYMHRRRPSVTQPLVSVDSTAYVLPALAPLLMAAAAAGLEAVARARENKRRPPGRLVALRNDGRRVHVVYHAPPDLLQAPCVVLEAGSNSWSPMWGEVANSLGKFARVLRYDRAGFGFSDGVGPHTERGVSKVAEDLVELLQTVDAGPPYVLVAHSLGALYANAVLRRLNRHDVCGVVYVDAASPETVRMLERVVPKRSPPVWLARSLGWLGVLRLLTPILLKQYSYAYGTELMGEAMATWSRGEWLMAYTGEWRDVFGGLRGGVSFEKGWLGDLPICVIVPDVYERTLGKEFIGGLQKQIAQWSTDAKVICVSNCGHFVQLERPEVVESAVQSVISRAGGTPSNHEND